MGDSFRIPILLWTAIAVLLLVTAVDLKGSLERHGVVFVVCDVGNGDALYFRSSTGMDIVIDFGKGADVAECLGRHMGFMDKTIEVAFVTHMHYDHYGGLRDLLQLYKFEQFIAPVGPAPSTSYTQTFTALKNSGTDIVSILDIVDEEVVVQLGNNESIRCVWPSTAGISDMPLREKNDPNAYSHVCVYIYGNARVVLTGDATPWVLQKNLSHPVLKGAHILKVPHHGSKQGITKDFLDFVHPLEAVVSVGAKNSYGHPSKSVVQMMHERQIEAKLTSSQGEIQYDISSDGTFSVHTRSR